MHRVLTEPSAVKEAVKAEVPRQLRKRIKATNQNRNLADQRVSQRLRRKLTSEYRHDIVEPEDLLHRDLTHWLSA